MAVEVEVHLPVAMADLLAATAVLPVAMAVLPAGTAVLPVGMVHRRVGTERRWQVLV